MYAQYAIIFVPLQKKRNVLMPKEQNKADDYRGKAKQGSWRISESTLLLLAVVGGSFDASSYNS